jgi:glycosyltransferase involved in cell wall biosynthesis
VNIDLVHYSAPPVVGGVESIIAQHARLMAQAGHRVRILAGRGSQFDERIPFVGIPKADSRHPQVESVKLMLDQGSAPAEFRILVDELRAALMEVCANTQVLIAHNVCSLNKNLALTAALRQLYERGGLKRLVLWHHDLAWTTSRYRSELHEGYPWDLLRSDWPGAIQVVVSEQRRRELSQLIGIPMESIRVIPNGLDIKRFLKLDAQTVEIVEKLDLLTAAPLLLLPVRITPRKNIELALSVLAALRHELPAARLVVTGPLGPHNPANTFYFEKLRRMRSELGLEKAAHFLAEDTPDFLPDSVISDFYHLADALLLPSREEGFGIPILEAGLTGMPIFCADIPSLRELGGEEVSYFSPDADPAEVARMIVQALRQENWLSLRWRVREEYPWEKIYQTHIAPLLAI